MMPWPRETTAVYAYEDAALYTFRRAERRGLAQDLGLAAPALPDHRADLARRVPPAGRAAALGPPHSEPPWKRRRKDGELALATKVSVASSFTKQSLEGVDLRVPIVVTAYGFPVDAFARRERAALARSPSLRSGHTICARARPTCSRPGSAPRFRTQSCTWSGRCGWRNHFWTTTPALFRHWPHLPKSELPARYSAADLCAFPTLGDGFGLVIQESMCCGTPVVTTPCGGGPECITDDVATDGSSLRAISTRWSTGSARPPPTASGYSRWAKRRGRGQSGGPGGKRAPRWSTLSLTQTLHEGPA